MGGLTYYDRLVGAPVPQSQPQVVQPHPQPGHGQTHHLERQQLMGSDQQCRGKDSWSIVI